MTTDTPMARSELTPCLPLQTPASGRASLPSLPPSLSTTQTSEHWTVTRHVCAAAYPRSRVGSYAAGSAYPSDAPGTRPTSTEVQNRVTAMHEEQYGAPLQGNKDDGHLWLAVNCYRTKMSRIASSASKKSRAATTMILAHATGLHKEVGVILRIEYTVRSYKILMLLHRHGNLPSIVWQTIWQKRVLMLKRFGAWIWSTKAIAPF